MQSLFDLRGQVVAVAGAAGAFGSVVARELVRQGCKVAIFDKNDDGLQQLASEFSSDSVFSEVFDVRHEAACQSALQSTSERWERLDGLINCVGLFEIIPATDMPEKVFSRIVETNLNAAFLMCRHAARIMIPQGCGRIINIASVSDSISNPGYAAYAASKAALTHLTRVLAVEWAGYTITVNAISPAMCDTQLTHSFLDQGDNRKNAESRIPLGRLFEPDDILGTVVLLLSRSGAFITGQAIHIDGGRTLS
ncbi:MAG: SDR family NAD(P)-dependent oxidoreductase [Acidiferrobacterales bacterium]|nr:SDR family NAD(P)-dependent oxidoreductase [Acidiferrobacterales bacterium]